MDRWDVVVVGAGIAGVSAVRTLAERGGIRVLLLNGEDAAPYKRTKASKHIAKGFHPEEFQLETEEWFKDHDVTLMNGITASNLNVSERTLTISNGSGTASGEDIAFDKLILATGAEPLFPKTVRTHEADSFFIVRTADDVQRLTAAAKRVKRVLIDGMGVLAVEVAAELNQMGLQVTLAGAAPQLMPRELSIRSGEILEELLAANGIKMRFQEEILSFEARRKGGFSVAMIRDSSAFDMVVFCIGIGPRKALADDAGINTNSGILVDGFLQTSAPGIYAAGDVAEHEDGAITHLWHAAEHQGRIAALNAAGEPTPFENIPFRLKCSVFDSYFFSIGKPKQPLDFGIEEQEINNRYQCFYYSGETLSGAVMVNDKDRAKTYEQAVRGRWPRDQVREELSL
jgi:NAD(P)H-nitrite reductase large subunit